MKKTISFLFVSCLFFIGCSRDGVTGLEPDLSMPVIKIVYPLDKPLLPQGFPLCIKVQVSDNRGLSSVWLEINDGHSYKVSYPVTGRSVEVIEKYTAPAGVSGELSAKIIATDESGNSAAKDIPFIIED